MKTKHQNLWDLPKTELIGNFRHSKMSILENKKNMNDFSFYLKKLIRKKLNTR